MTYLTVTLLKNESASRIALSRLKAANVSSLAHATEYLMTN